MKLLKLFLLSAAMTCLGSHPVQAQSELYPHHFNLSEVTLLDSPFKTAMDLNIGHLMQYDVDRLLTPFIRQAGLSSGVYAGWLSQHLNFENWGGGGFDLSGHVGGHYLSALALAYAACHDAGTKARLKERLDYMLGVLKDCQDAYDNNTHGLYGFIGGQPINSAWTGLYAGDLTEFNKVRGWVPFYCQHKVLAGLRDAYLYAGSGVAKELFRKLADWSVNVVGKLSDSAMQDVLNTEHGGMNESMADAYSLFGDKKYLDAARKYSHQTMVDGMQTLNTTFLDNRHANTQVPKYIGFERVAENDAAATRYTLAADNFWNDVAHNRTTCIGGNSVNEHFLSVGNSNRYIDYPDGPESCNSNNMLKLSEMLSDKTHDARYADFYEYTMLNHILSTQDPTTGGYVYFTTLRPQGYRIYSQVNQGMWCCVGTGMENHSKYGHFIYTHDGAETVYVNLFMASRLDNADFALTQETGYPYEQQTKITVERDGSYTIAIRHPWWATADYAVSVNGQRQTIAVTPGQAGYVKLNRRWSAGDVITVKLPMALRTVDCPNYTDYIAFEYGPVLLGARTTALDAADADTTGLKTETLRNEYAGSGRMDHSPGAVGTSKPLTTAPLLIGPRDEMLSRVKVADLSKLRFTIDASRSDAPDYAWSTLMLMPFHEIHHARYMVYWYGQTAENYAASDMALSEQAGKLLADRTIDFVATGEQQSEAGHEYSYSLDSSTGSYMDETYRDAKANGYIQYSLFNPGGVKDSLSVLCRFTTADAGRMGTLTVDGVKIADITIPKTVKGSVGGFYNVEYPIPASLAVDAQGRAKSKFVVRLTASAATLCPGIYYLRLMRGYTDNKYRFMAHNWITGDGARLAADNIKYDAVSNVITVNRAGANNVCLMLDYNNLDYYITPSQKYLMVMGRNLSLAAGASYLWWLNGSNKGTQVQPTVAKTVSMNGLDYQVIAWDMTRSGIATNISATADTDICLGRTIFGLTSTTGTSYIHGINFVADVNAAVTGIASAEADDHARDTYYNMQGMRIATPRHGVYLKKGRKILL